MNTSHEHKINKKTLNPDLLATTKRGNSIETLHYGWVCILNKKKKIIYKKGNIKDKIYLRSALKPIQATIVVDNNIEITPKELAMVCGSHSGSKEHIQVLKVFMRKHKLLLSNLRCGTHLPSDENEKNKLLRLNKSPEPLHNNCSGKHLGMLAVCKKNNWDLKTYLNPGHPLQKNVLKKITELSETKNISIGVDGCSVPTFALPLINIAKMFSNFTHSTNKNYSKIIRAMTKYPYYSGGKDQIDTEIMKRSKGKLIAKVGAEGIIVVAFNGNSAVVKIADGSARARSFVILKLLIKLGWLKEEEIKGSVLEGILNGEIRNHVGKIVGKIEFLINS